MSGIVHCKMPRYTSLCTKPGMEHDDETGLQNTNSPHHTPYAIHILEPITRIYYVHCHALVRPSSFKVQTHIDGMVEVGD